MKIKLINKETKEVIMIYNNVVTFNTTHIVTENYGLKGYVYATEQQIFEEVK